MILRNNDVIKKSLESESIPNGLNENPFIYNCNFWSYRKNTQYFDNKIRSEHK